MRIVLKIDKIIREFDSNTSAEKSKSKKQLRTYFQEYTDCPKNKDCTLPQSIIEIIHGKPKNIRNLAMMVLHAIGSSNIFNTRETDGKLIELFDKNIEDIYKIFNIKSDDQTCDKIPAIKEIHKEFCVKLNFIIDFDDNIHSILSNRTEIEKTIRNSGLNSYLNYLDFRKISKSITKHLKYS